MKTNGDNRRPKKNWHLNIKMDDSEMNYYLDYLKKNERRLIRESCCCV